jgi:hypothetical protein
LINFGWLKALAALAGWARLMTQPFYYSNKPHLNAAYFLMLNFVI